MSLDLHGPERAFIVVERYGDPRLSKWRVRQVQPLTFNWVQDDSGEWRQDMIMYQPMTYPEPVPDYSDEETCRILVAEVRRADKTGAPVPLHVIESTLPPAYFNPGTVVMNGETIGSLWAIAYWRGWAFRYERAALGAPWRRVAVTWGMG